MRRKADGIGPDVAEVDAGRQGTGRLRLAHDRQARPRGLFDVLRQFEGGEGGGARGVVPARDALPGRLGRRVRDDDGGERATVGD